MTARGAAAVAGHAGRLQAVVNAFGGASPGVYQLLQLASLGRAGGGTGAQRVTGLGSLLRSVAADHGAVVVVVDGAPVGAAAVAALAERFLSCLLAGRGALLGATLQRELRAPAVRTARWARGRRVTDLPRFQHAVATLGLTVRIAGGRAPRGATAIVLLGLTGGAAHLARRTLRRIGRGGRPVGGPARAAAGPATPSAVGNVSSRLLVLRDWCQAACGMGAGDQDTEDDSGGGGSRTLRHRDAPCARG